MNVRPAIMKLVIPEISWHNRDPVLSVHFQAANTEDGHCRLATGGSDSHVFVSNFTSTVKFGAFVSNDVLRYSFSDMENQSRRLECERRVCCRFDQTSKGG